MNQESLRKKYGLPSKNFLIGSFQRDTEGHDLKTPKLEKGPDIFCDAVLKIREDRRSKNLSDPEVLLAGWRRQYVISRLEAAKIKYYYHELPQFDTINDFYNALDLYIVGSRYEGGPQSIFECANTYTPIISTDVGAASEILSPKSIFEPGSVLDCSPDIQFAKEKVSNLLIPKGFAPFENFLRRVHEKK